MLGHSRRMVCADQKDYQVAAKVSEDITPLIDYKCLPNHRHHPGLKTERKEADFGKMASNSLLARKSVAEQLAASAVERRTGCKVFRTD